MTHPEDTAKGARAMYECDPTWYSAHRKPLAWSDLNKPFRDKFCNDFSAGLAAIPDHSAELLEALERATTHLEDSQYGVERRMAEDFKKIIDKARARKGEV